MGPIEIRQAELFAYDFYLALNPLLNPQLIHPDFAFLWNRTAHEEAHARTQPLPERDDFDFHPLRRELRRNRFWQRYRVACMTPDTPKPSSWEMMLPFRCRPKQLSLHFKVAPERTESRAQAVVLLWPFGWSSNVQVSLRGSFTLRQLQETVQCFAGDKDSFDTKEGPRNLSGVFSLLSKRIDKAIRAEGAELGAVRLIDRQRLVAITVSDPPLPWYCDDSLATDDRARIHAALLGRDVPHNAVSLRRKLPSEQTPQGGFRVVRLSGTAFALTYFEHGSLLALSGASLERKKGESSLRCLASNLRTCSLVSLALAGFLKHGRRHARRQEAYDAALDGAKIALSNLPLTYGNCFCSDLFAHHGSLDGFRPSKLKG